MGQEQHEEQEEPQGLFFFLLLPQSYPTCIRPVGVPGTTSIQSAVSIKANEAAQELFAEHLRRTAKDQIGRRGNPGLSPAGSMEPIVKCDRFEFRSPTWMGLDGHECSWVALNGPEWSWMVLNGPGWSWMVLNGPEWS